MSGLYWGALKLTNQKQTPFNMATRELDTRHSWKHSALNRRFAGRTLFLAAFEKPDLTAYHTTIHPTSGRTFIIQLTELEPRSVEAPTSSTRGACAGKYRVIDPCYFWNDIE